MAKKSILFIFVLALVLGLAYGWGFWRAPSTEAPTISVDESGQADPVSERDEKVSVSSEPESMTEKLRVPWELVFLPEGEMLVTERLGILKQLGTDGAEIAVPDVRQIGEGGLLGMTLHPDFSNNHWIYLYFTTDTDGQLKNVVERYVLGDQKLTERTRILDGIPADSNHNGGRIAFGPDGFFYVTTGDAGNSDLAQNPQSLAGKILRVGEDGSLPEDNPFSNAVYSYGHRNVQGIVWDGSGRLWATEHGRSGALSGYDELNLIERGANYGWPTIQGDQQREGMRTAQKNSGATTTWAPSGMAFFDGSIFFVGLRGQALYEYIISEDQLVEHLKNQFGRLRQVKIGPDGNFYLLTNNTDGRGKPKEGDDKLIRLAPSNFSRGQENNSDGDKAVLLDQSGFVSPMDQAKKRISKKLSGCLSHRKLRRLPMTNSMADWL